MDLLRLKKAKIIGAMIHYKEPKQKLILKIYK